MRPTASPTGGTELEGEPGMDYFRQSAVTLIQASHGKVDTNAPDKIVVELDGLSFKLIRFGYIVAHGMVEFQVASSFLNKT